MQQNPIQPLYTDEKGVIRFKENKIVQYLLDKGDVNMNDLAMIDFSQTDQEQFAQLIGYSHSGFGELSYVSDEVYDAAELQFKEGKSEHDARLRVLREQLDEIKTMVRGLADQIDTIED